LVGLRDQIRCDNPSVVHLELQLVQIQPCESGPRSRAWGGNEATLSALTLRSRWSWSWDLSGGADLAPDFGQLSRQVDKLASKRYV